MPEIGKPIGNNPFSGISMDNSKDKKDVGKDLNKMVGIKEESRFVDAKTHNKIGKDGFLKLLSHQLANQDPLKPMDQKQFAADLAQFSQLEQLTNMNQKMDNMNKNESPQMKFYGASFLGKEVLTKGTSVNFNGEDATDIPFYLDKPGKKVFVRIFDKNRQMIGQIVQENLGKGQQVLNWDGMQLDGAPATKGTYSIQVHAFDNDFNPFQGDTQAKGTVTGVHFENDETILTLKDGKKIFLRDVDSFSMPKESSSLSKIGPSLPKNAAEAYNQNESQL